MCPFACTWNHNQAGEVKPFVSFGGDLWLKPEDPTHPSYQSEIISPIGPPPNDTAFEAKLQKDKMIQKYIQAKQRALVNVES